ncbi:MAG: hypothetical protein FWD33_01545 [Alphaproteobacteria bacterium]|nr:hypothetical protein [Alphaproteobacteria bacterium]
MKVTTNISNSLSQILADPRVLNDKTGTEAYARPIVSANTVADMTPEKLALRNEAIKKEFAGLPRTTAYALRAYAFHQI